MDVSKDFESVFTDMVKREICVGHSLLYVCYASFLESKGKLYDAHIVYQSAISRSLSLPTLFICFALILEIYGRYLP